MSKLTTYLTFLAVITASLAASATDKTLSHTWSLGFGDTESQLCYDVKADAAGDVVICGRFQGTVDFGAGPLTSAGGWDAYVAKFDASGTCLWSLGFGDPDNQFANSVVFDSWGNVILSGYYLSNIDLGGGPLPSSGSYDCFVAKYDAGGAHLWSRRYGDADGEVFWGCAADAAGNIVLTGRYLATIDFGGGPLVSAGGLDVFVVKLDPNGNHIWSNSYGDPDSQYGNGVAVDAAGNVVITGYFHGTVDFGSGPLVNTGYFDVFVAKYDAAGNGLWSRGIGDDDYQYGIHVAVDAAGGVLVAGYFQGAADFGGGPLVSAGGYDAYLAKYDAGGAHLWSRRFGDAADQYGTAVAADASGHVVLAGYFESTVDFGGGPLVSADATDVSLAIFDTAGGHVWSDRFGGPYSESNWGVDTGPSGELVVSGMFNHTIDFGGGPLVCAGLNDIFLAKFDMTPVPTLLQGFSCAYDGVGVELEWRLSEAGADASFSVLRREVDRPGYVELENPEISSDGAMYACADRDVEHGTAYVYRVDMTEGGHGLTLFETDRIEIPAASLRLSQNVPNPFNPATTIRYFLPERCTVTLEIVDAAGRRVARLVDRETKVGHNTAVWQGRDDRGDAVASGAYFYRLSTGRETMTKKMILLR